MNRTWHLITPEYPPEAGGVSDFSSLLTEGLARRGVGIEVWCPTAGDATQLPGIHVHPTLGDFGPSALANTKRWIRRAGLRIIHSDSKGIYLPVPGRQSGLHLPWLEQPKWLMKRFGVHSLVIAEKPIRLGS